MKLEAGPGMLHVRVGARFGAREAERIAEAVAAFSPVSKVTVDFGRTRDFEDAALVPLSRSLGGLAGAEVVVRGLTRHHARLLRHLGLDDRPEARRP
jgi:hypothetical protein